MKYRLLILMLAIVVAAKQQDTLSAQNAGVGDEIDVSGEWIGVIAWQRYDTPPGTVGTVRVYRLNILQDGQQLRAAHLTDGGDVLITQPVERYDDPQNYGFEGFLQETSLQFDAVPVFFGSCSISITLEYGEVGGVPVLVGDWQYHPILPAPAGTLEADVVVPDMVVGCDLPAYGPITLIRFDS